MIKYSTEYSRDVPTQPRAHRLSFFLSRRMFLMLFLGFMSGLPLALSSTTLQAWLTTAGLSLVSLGLLSLIGQPYLYKFLWAPLLDRYIPPLFGRRRGWIILMQLGLSICLATMALVDPQVSPFLLIGLAVGVACLSATQDVAIDAYRTELLEPDERGIGSAMFVGGYRIGMLISGGLALILAGLLGWRWTYFFMGILMISGILITACSPEPEAPLTPPSRLIDAIYRPLVELFSRHRMISIVSFIILYKLGNAFALSLTTPFLLRGLHYSLIDIGFLYKVVGFAATLIGVFLGGITMVRIGLYRALLYYGILQAVSNLMFMLLASVGKHYVLLAVTIFVENLCDGLGTAALLALLMGLCDLRYTATQFAFLSALSALARIFSGFFSGFLVQDFGWVLFYFFTVIFAIPGLALLVSLRNKIENIGQSKCTEHISVNTPSLDEGF